MLYQLSYVRVGSILALPDGIPAHKRARPAYGATSAFVRTEKAASAESQTPPLTRCFTGSRGAK
jgi:hypothetical protein